MIYCSRLGGLNMQPVRRLRKTVTMTLSSRCVIYFCSDEFQWEKIQLDKFQQLEQYMNVSKNFATYRLILKLAMEEANKHGWVTDKIVIPFTSIVLQDVYFIKTHSKDYTPAGGINLKVEFRSINIPKLKFFHLEILFHGQFHFRRICAM